MQQHLEFSDSPSFTLCALCALLSPYPLFHPLSLSHSHSCIVLLILSINPALGLSLFPCLSHYSKRILLISPLSLHTAFPKQEQSCNPFTALPVNSFHPNNPKRLTTRPRYCQGKGRREGAECTGDGKQRPYRKREERGEDTRGAKERGSRRRELVSQ